MSDAHTKSHCFIPPTARALLVAPQAIAMHDVRGHEAVQADPLVWRELETRDEGPKDAEPWGAVVADRAGEHGLRGGRGR